MTGVQTCALPILILYCADYFENQNGISGTMMRTPGLWELAKRWEMKFITIRDLQHYRKCREKLVDRMTAAVMPTKYGAFTAYGYVNRLNGEHHVALVKGEIGDGRDVLCRVHSECLTGILCHAENRGLMCPKSPFGWPLRLFYRLFCPDGRRD